MKKKLISKKVFYNSYIIFLVLIGIISIFFFREEKAKNMIAPDINGKPIALKRDQQDVEKIAKISAVSLDEGYDLYQPLAGSSGYRYGPSIIYYEDETMDAYFASQGNNNSEWDWITYRHYDGKNWSKEKIVLQPSGGDLDCYSTCDPAVICFGGYYYLGYTSTICSTDGGINNNIFVARSKNPDGPFEKWNGKGWGGDPWPLIHFEENNTSWGAGEPSFVIADDRLYIYYSWNCPEGFLLKLSTAELTENWPLTVQYEGVVDGKYGDSVDVCFNEKLHKFIGVNVEGFLSDNSGLRFMESDDGINFTESGVLKEHVSQFAHSCGIAKQPNGHIDLDKDLLIGYAYGKKWGQWALHIQGVRLSAYLGERKSFSNHDNVYRDPCDYSGGNNYLTGISVAPRIIDVMITDRFVNIPVYAYSHYGYGELISDSDIYFSDYDESIITISKQRIVPVGTGTTNVTVYYADKYTTFKVIVHDRNYVSRAYPRVMSISSLNTDKNWYIEDEGMNHEIQIRTYMVFEDGIVSEGYNDYGADHPKYPVKAEGSIYHFEYETSDENILTISDSGHVFLHNPGKATIRVTLGNLSYEFEVTVNKRRLN